MGCRAVAGCSRRELAALSATHALRGPPSEWHGPQTRSLVASIDETVRSLVDLIDLVATDEDSLEQSEPLEHQLLNLVWVLSSDA